MQQIGSSELNFFDRSGAEKRVAEYWAKRELEKSKHKLEKLKEMSDSVKLINAIIIKIIESSGNGYNYFIVENPVGWNELVEWYLVSECGFGVWHYTDSGNKSIIW